MPEKPLVKQPIYQQLYDRLRQRVESGEFKPGGKFLTERQVSDAYGVSRTTANKALSTLVAEGLLEFRKGLGTFVRHSGLDIDLRRLMSFTDKAGSSGMKARTKVLAFERCSLEQAPSEVQARMGSESQDGLFCMLRLRLADGEPVILEHRWVNAEMVPEMRKQDVGGSIYEYWTHQCGLEIGASEQTIRAVLLSAEQAKMLQTSRHSPALMIQALGRLESGAVLWYEETLYRGDAWAFQNCLGGPEGRRPAIGKLVSQDEA